MMHSIYLYCAIFGSALVVLNFLTLLMGVGGDSDGGADSFDGDGGGDVGGDAGDADGDSADASESHLDHGGVFLRMFTLRTVTAGVAFFGLGGLACAGTSLADAAVLGVAVASGVIGMYLVYRMCRSLSAFNHSGSLTLASAVGSTGTVYLRIPGARAGVGKATVLQQEREVEYDAVTDDPNGLAPGEPIKIVETLASNQVLVERVR